jgi:hypothetical protein
MALVYFRRIVAPYNKPSVNKQSLWGPTHKLKPVFIFGMYFSLIQAFYCHKTFFVTVSMEFFIDIILPADSASNINEYQEYYLGVKAAGA